MAQALTPELLALDWGTSSLRGALLDARGSVIEERQAPQGILAVPAGGFERVFNDLFGDWMRRRRLPCLIAGMAGSRQGWAEAAYCPCPAGLDELARALLRVDERIAIVPGLRTEDGGVPDVMRGEEVQVLGAAVLAGIDEGVFVLPGTHSKWVTLQGGRITGFRTYMTGEVYGLLAQHSILARMLDAQAPLDEAAFLEGVSRAEAGHGLLHNAFGARTLALFDRMPREVLASYLSGMVIGEELRTQALPVGHAAIVVGAPALTRRYQLALSAGGRAAHVLGAEAGWAGLSRVHEAAQQGARLVD